MGTSLTEGLNRPGWLARPFLCAFGEKMGILILVKTFLSFFVAKMGKPALYRENTNP